LIFHISVSLFYRQAISNDTALQGLREFE